DIVVEDPEISRKHCALEVHGNSALLVDLGSTNGTFIEGQRIETHELEHLAEFRIGATTLMFTVSQKE
ncbi:MAG: FHA domain-containing protein, partial [Candidatus Acidoferrales bacterium]